MKRYIIFGLFCFSSYFNAVVTYKHMEDSKLVLVCKGKESTGNLTIAPIIFSFNVPLDLYKEYYGVFGAQFVKRELKEITKFWANNAADSDVLREVFDGFQEASEKDAKQESVDLNYSMWPGIRALTNPLSQEEVASVAGLSQFCTFVVTPYPHEESNKLPKVNFILIARKFYQLPDIGIDTEGTYKIMNIDDILSRFNGEILIREMVLVDPPTGSVGGMRGSVYRFCNSYFCRDISLCKDRFATALDDFGQFDKEYVQSNGFAKFHRSEQWSCPFEI